LVYLKHYNAFNFYFAKPINEIIANIKVDHVIQYQDNLYYDNTIELLQQFYNFQEIPEKLAEIISIYDRYKFLNT